MRRQGEGSPTSPARMSVVNIQSLHHPATEADKPTTPDLRPRRRVPPEAPRGHRGRYVWLAAWAVCAVTATVAHGSLPVFENNTPAGFSPEDSTSRQSFVEATEITVRVDLNQAVTPTYPAIGHFHNLERSESLDTTSVDGGQVDVALTPGGIVHIAWIAHEKLPTMATPIYYVRYARSNDDGATFSTPVSVSGSLRFDLVTADPNGTSFSSIDLEVDSQGNPRVVYAMNESPDGKTAAFSSNYDNVYLNHSQNGGASWLPANRAILVNDTTTVGNVEGRTAAFPRMAIDERDNIFITYVRGTSRGGGAGTDDVMMAKVDRETSPFSMTAVGASGTVGSAGGVRISPNANRQTGPDLAVGRGDVLHVLYFHEEAANSDIEHKTVLADDWDDVSALGWDASANGADVDDFDPRAPNNPALNRFASFVFPTVVVDTVSSPDKIYALYKFGDAAFETVFYNRYTYDHAVGAGAGWNTGTAQAVWSTAASPLFASGDREFNIEQDWTVVDRVSAVVDDRRNDIGELHIVFSAGYSNPGLHDRQPWTDFGPAGEHDIYYGFFNGTSWTLPEKVADDDSDTGIEDGIAATDVFLSKPALARRAGETNVYIAFTGGLAEGHGVQGINNTDSHPYFKVLGRDVAFEDESQPVGGFQYDLNYTPVNPHDPSANDVWNNVVYVHVADNLTGGGLGATGKKGDGFLAGDWENVGTSLQDEDKSFEGSINEDASTDHEWGDDDDKVGLLVKLNVLGSDSPTNLQLITSSTAADGGAGARTVRVATTPPSSVAIGDFFLLGARIDIVDANTSPTISLSQPDGVADTANTSFAIRYSLSDPDDDFGSGLLAAFYFAESGGLNSVQDIRIFGTLIADENDNTAVNNSGTNDLIEGSNQTYSWDDPPTALKTLLFASILQAPSADYFIYMIAEDGKNPPVFVRSSGTLTVRHKPIVLHVDPAGRETVDTGIRSGTNANPYDLDFTVRDYDNQGTSQVALFYSAFSGLASVSVSGTYPSQSFALGKSVSGTRAIYIENSDTLTSADTEFSWDTTDSVFVSPDSAAVEAGHYYLYAVVSDSIDVVVGHSIGQVIVRHSPFFVFYEPAKDTHKKLDSGSQPVYTIQWQKGPGDSDFDDDADIDLYFTTDNPADINYEDDPDSLLKDVDTRPLVVDLSENDTMDMYVWDFRSPPEEVPKDNKRVWLYAVISDGDGNVNVVLGGSVTVTHTPYINLTTSDLDNLTSFLQNDVLRVAWQDYMVDDGSGTEDAYIRVYAAPSATSYGRLSTLDAAVNGTTTFLINSTSGTLATAVDTLRESGDDFYDWNTKLFGAAGTTYDIYVAISADSTFADNMAAGIQLSTSSTPLSIGVAGATPNVSLSPTDQTISIGDTLTFDVMLQHSKPINLVQVVLTIASTDFAIRDQDASKTGTQPFLDLDNVFSSTLAIENKFESSGNQLRFAKSTFTGQVVGTTTQPEALARFQLIATDNLQATPSLVFATGSTGTVLGLVGNSDPLHTGGGLSVLPAQLTRQARGQIVATVKLEGRTIPPAVSNYTSLLDIHLRLPGSTIDLKDANFISANDDDTATTDTVEVSVAANGALTLVSIPAGRYVLTVKDTSHVSGRTDTITVRNGETVTISSGNKNGFFGSDLRGDPTVLLPDNGRELIAGDVSEDNEINEDDVNLIIAAWGTDHTVNNFEQADINNDGIVGAADLTVTTSNFGTSQGFGAPPVYKTATIDGGRPGARNDQAVLELRLINTRPDRAVAPGEVIGIEVRGSDLKDLAGYEFRIDLDPTRLRPLVDRVDQGDVFAANPHGSVFDVRVEDGSLRVLSSRIGKQWSAAGTGSLAKLWFEVTDNGAEESITLGDGVLLNTGYQPDEVAWSNSLFEMLLPWQPALDVNYPNPFNPTTAIPFALHGPTDDLRLQIYNLLGQRVRTLLSGPMAPGFHTIVWNGRDDAGRQVAAGLYISELRTAEFRQTRKMTLVK